jgi:hypothetical protein
MLLILYFLKFDKGTDARLNSFLNICDPFHIHHFYLFNFQQAVSDKQTGAENTGPLA